MLRVRFLCSFQATEVGKSPTDTNRYITSLSFTQPRTCEDDVDQNKPGSATNVPPPLEDLHVSHALMNIFDHSLVFERQISVFSVPNAE